MEHLSDGWPGFRPPVAVVLSGARGEAPRGVCTDVSIKQIVCVIDIGFIDVND